MKRQPRLLSCALLGMAALLIPAPDLWAIPFSQARIIIETNATAGDAGIQIFVDATGWSRLEVADPDRERIFEVAGSGSIGMTGVTELFFESAEPSFEDLPLDQLLARFQEGTYTFSGTTVDGKQLSGKATLKHNIPDGPTIVSPADGAALNAASPVIIDWDPVTTPFEGTALPVTIAAYQVIVEREKPQPLIAFSVTLPATVTQVTVPAEFIQANADYKFEVLAIEESGNQTISESIFTTEAGPGSGSRRASGEPAPASATSPSLRQNQPNPFNPVTTLAFELPRDGDVRLRVIDVHGRVVRTLVSSRLPAGRHEATWDGRDGRGHPVASGVYVAVLSGPGLSESRRMVLAR